VTLPFRELTAKQAHSELGRYRIVDVREEHEFHGPLGFLEGAELIPLRTLAQNAERLDDTRPLLLVCRSGGRSGKACEILQQLGRKNVTNLAGGMIGWNRAALPVQRSQVETLTALVEQIVAFAAQVGGQEREALVETLRERLEAQNLSYEVPSHAAVEALIRSVGESLAAADPPDLALSLAAFRRSLAAL